MSRLKIDGKYWHTAGTIHYIKEHAERIQQKCKLRGAKTRIIHKKLSLDEFWLVYTDKDYNWLCDVDKEPGNFE